MLSSMLHDCHSRATSRTATIMVEDDGVQIETAIHTRHYGRAEVHPHTEQTSSAVLYRDVVSSVVNDNDRSRVDEMTHGRGPEIRRDATSRLREVVAVVGKFAGGSREVAHGWMQSFEQAMEFFGMSRDEWVTMAGMLFEGNARKWWFSVRDECVDWEALSSRFGERFGVEIEMEKRLFDFEMMRKGVSEDVEDFLRRFREKCPYSRLSEIERVMRF